MSNFNKNDFKVGDVVLFDKNSVHKNLGSASQVIERADYRAFIFEMCKNEKYIIVSLRNDAFRIALPKNLFLGPLNVRF